jgi:hypothetical protein
MISTSKDTFFELSDRKERLVKVTTHLHPYVYDADNNYLGPDKPRCPANDSKDIH